MVDNSLVFIISKNPQEVIYNNDDGDVDTWRSESVSCLFPGLTEPVLIRLDVDTKLSDQLKVRVVRLWIEIGVFSHTVHHGSTGSIRSDHRGGVYVRRKQEC